MDKHDNSERRNDKRVAVLEGRVLCHRQGRSDFYSVTNLSKGGVCLEEGADIALGTHVVLDMTIKGVRHDRVHGNVVRNKLSVGVMFKNLEFVAGTEINEIQWDA